ncbi:GNAT family N-acetyltransferase [Glycomyces sp. L485]|uniref:GNAT family N-acetyltransferase n=1 Tax=Glycomyces sp. L485 TaxID=2909235 RepID=UPI001F4A66C3|nr:GNAT family N-acetyltransferase [Glycomyces sp. L485]
MNTVRISQIDRPGPVLAAVYRELLEPNFPPHELDSLSDIEAALQEGTASVLVAFDVEGRPVAVAVGDWAEAQRVQLLSYLAVDPAHRGAGIGGRLLEAAVERWSGSYGPCVIVAELEHPGAAVGREAWGDPRRRYDFYGRHGAKVLDLPYFQPSLRPGEGRAYGMVLIVLHLDEALLAPERDHVAAAPIRGFLEDYFLVTEGAVPDDPAGKALFDAAGGPSGIALLDPAATPLADLPRSTAAPTGSGTAD